MCGICGLYAPSGRPPEAVVDAMRARVRHRGPDQGSTDAFGPCVLGHQRLQVLDPEQGYQPVANETGDVVAVFNGELYNFAELRAELADRGHEVRGRGDTPVIPHLYEEYGPRFVEHLDGMFAVALWDTSRVGRAAFISNQSLNGMVARIYAPADPSKLVWIALVAIVLVGPATR